MYAANERPVNKDMITKFMPKNPVLPIAINDIEEDYPDVSFTNSSFAMKINLELPTVDGSLSYFNGYSTAPGFGCIVISAPGNILTINPSLKTYRMHMIGCDFATALGSFIGLRGEMAYRNYEDGLTYKWDGNNNDLVIQYSYVPNHDLQYVLGVDKAIKNFSFILQYAGIYVFDFEDISAPANPFFPIDIELEKKNRLINRQADQVGHSILFRPAWSLLHETLSLEFAGMYSFNTKELMFRPKISYQITDALSASCGGELYVGSDESLFELIEEEVSAGFIAFKASF